MFVDLLIRFEVQLILTFLTIVLLIFAYLTFDYFADWLRWKLGLFRLKGLAETEERRYWSQKEAVARAKRLLYQEKNIMLNLKDTLRMERKNRLDKLKKEDRDA